jgi:hypothetical protein
MKITAMIHFKGISSFIKKSEYATGTLYMKHTSVDQIMSQGTVNAKIIKVGTFLSLFLKHSIKNAVLPSKENTRRHK